MCSDKKRFRILEHNVAFLELNSPRTQALDFPPLEGQTRLKTLFNEIVMAGLPIDCNGRTAWGSLLLVCCHRFRVILTYSSKLAILLESPRET